MNGKIHSKALLNGLMKRFTQMNIHSTSVEEYRVAFAKMIEFFRFIAHKIPVGIKVHRIRIHNGETEFTHLKELWCPPAHMTTMGRLNEKGDQILYTSSGGDTAYRELNPPVGSIVSCLECEVIEPILSVDIGLLKYNPNREGFLKQWAFDNAKGLKIVYQNNKELMAIDTRLKEFMITQFVRSVPKGSEHLYRLTAAIAKQFFLSKDLEAISYPSIKSQMRDINFAFPAHVALKKLKPIRIDVHEILPSASGSNLTRVLPIKGCYENLNFEDALVYTNPREIIGWATKD
nr:hypothetical protein [Pedobacter panaciterrae]